jgi:transcriptional regulator with XRE-family HTH domain
VLSVTSRDEVFVLFFRCGWLQFMINHVEGSSRSGGSGQSRPAGVDRLVGRRIRLRRMLLEIDPEHLANDLFLTAPVLARLEAGEQRPAPSLLSRIAGYLGVSVTWFFRDFSTRRTGAESSAPEEDANLPLKQEQQAGIGEEMLELVDHFVQITDAADRKSILAFARERVPKHGRD